MNACYSSAEHRGVLQGYGGDAADAKRVHDALPPRNNRHDAARTGKVVSLENTWKQLANVLRCDKV